MPAFEPTVFEFTVFDADGVASPSVYSRMMANLLPPGRVWRLSAGSFLAKLLIACADEIVRLETRSDALLNESDPLTMDELLPEYERELDIDPTGTTEERKARVVAREVAEQGVRPEDFRIALAPLLGQDVADVVVIERSRADAIAMADDREIYRFFIYRDPTLPGTYFLDSAQALVDELAHSYTKGYVIESVDFLCDDPFSLTDRDILGA